VRAVTAARAASGSMSSVSGSISAKTGVAPVCRMAFTVAGQVNELVTTSLPAPTPAATSERCSASVHDDVAMAWGTPVRSAKRCSSSAVRGPDVSQPERIVATTDSTSSAPITGGENASIVSRTGLPPSIASLVVAERLIAPRT